MVSYRYLGFLPRVIFLMLMSAFIIIASGDRFKTPRDLHQTSGYIQSISESFPYSSGGRSYRSSPGVLVFALSGSSVVFEFKDRKHYGEVKQTLTQTHSPVMIWYDVSSFHDMKFWQIEVDGKKIISFEETRAKSESLFYAGTVFFFIGLFLFLGWAWWKFHKSKL